MSFFNDFASGLESYPVDSVTVSITDVAIQTGTAGSVNVNEVWKFKVNVQNNGHVNMTGVSLHVNGLNGATVGTAAAGPFSAGITTGSLTVNGGGSQKSGFLYFKAPNTAKAAGTDLVNAHIADWSGNLDHMFNNHTNHAVTPAAIYEAQVFP